MLGTGMAVGGAFGAYRQQVLLTVLAVGCLALAAAPAMGQSGRAKGYARPASSGTPAAPQAELHRWGALAGLAGSHWMRVDKRPDLHLRYSWETPGSTLSYSGLDIRGEPIAGRFLRDVGGSAISNAMLYKGAFSQTSITLTADGFIEEGVIKGKRIRERYVRSGPDAFTVTAEVNDGKTWTHLKTASLVKVSEAMVAALGWAQTPGEAKSGFFKDLGTAIRAGALAGVADGLREGVRDGVRHRSAEAIGGKQAVQPQPAAAAN